MYDTYDLLVRLDMMFVPPPGMHHNITREGGMLRVNIAVNDASGSRFIPVSISGSDLEQGAKFLAGRISDLLPARE